jgi:hypothetical protein
MAAFTQTMATGLFEKYPRLQCAVLEAGSNWITAWLDRLDHKVERGGFPTSLKLLPSEYFRRQCVISADPDETLTAPVVEHLGDDYVIWASDYPHLDASFGVVKELRERLASLPLVPQAILECLELPSRAPPIAQRRGPEAAVPEVEASWGLAFEAGA